MQPHQLIPTPHLNKLEQLMQHNWKIEPEIARQIHNTKHDALREIEDKPKFYGQFILTYPNAMYYLTNHQAQFQVKQAFDEDRFEVHY